MTNVIINSCCAKIGSCKTIIQCSFGRNTAAANRTIHEYPVTYKKFFKLFQPGRKFTKEAIEFFPYNIVEVAFKTSDASDVCCETCATDLFINLIN